MSELGLKKGMAAVAAVLLSCSGAAQATTCMVMGERSALVHSSEGDRAPVFLAQSCESLRLMSGKAMVSWAGRDGKAHFVPVGPNGVAQLPAAGAEERSASSVWAELASKRDAQRSAYMRSIGIDKGHRLYVPEAGLNLQAQAGSTLRLWLQSEGGEARLLLERTAPATGPVVLGRDVLAAGAQYQLEWVPASPAVAETGADAATEAGPEHWRIRLLTEAEQRNLDEQLLLVNEQVPDPTQRALVQAMVFEQLKLPLNMRLALVEPKQRQTSGASPSAQP